VIDWILVIPLGAFLLFGFGYLVAEKKYTKEKWTDIFF
jgi:hypothetical protein